MREEKKKKKVMIAIDQSDCSHYALEWTLQNQQETISTNQLIIFSAQRPLDFSYFYASTYGAPPADLIHNLQEKQKKVTLALLDRAKQICAQYGIVAEVMTEVGEPQQAICEVAEKNEVTLLIVGSRGRGAIQRAFLGSVSNYCSRNAKCPVLIVRRTT